MSTKFAARATRHFAVPATESPPDRLGMFENATGRAKRPDVNFRIENKPLQRSAACLNTARLREATVRPSPRPTMTEPLCRQVTTACLR
jgi:hypothetical protein